MQIQHVKLIIKNDVASFFIHFYVSDELICNLECFDYLINIQYLKNAFNQLTKPPLKPMTFYLKDYYANDIEFKISPCPPYDWLVLTLPINKQNNQIILDRIQFLQEINDCIKELSKST